MKPALTGVGTVQRWQPVCQMFESPSLPQPASAEGHVWTIDTVGHTLAVLVNIFPGLWATKNETNRLTMAPKGLFRRR
jgi:hypothetical protein